jgi:hypothetical protein
MSRFEPDGGPFSRADLDLLTGFVTDSWRSGVDRDWSARAGTLDWSCVETANHTADAVLAVAFFLASRKQDGYPEWGWSVPTNDRPEALVEALAAVGRVLSGVIATAEPGTRAVIWRRPQVTTGSVDDFAARGGLELILHAHDVCAGLGIPFAPPADLCGRLRDHTREWVHWTTPGWHALPATDDAWGDLLDASGRMKME